MRSRIVAVFGDDFDDGTAYDDAVSDAADFFGLFCRVDAETDGTRYVRDLLSRIDDFFEVRLDFRPRPRDAQGGNDVQETFADVGDFLDTVFRRRRDHGDDVDAMGFSGSGTFIAFFKGHIGDDDAVHAGFLAAGKEFFSAVMEDGIEVGQKDQGNLRFLADPFDQGKDVVDARPCFQGPQVRFLDDDAFGDGVGKGCRFR